jgi:simple sugar transport system ATP-binding protein
VRTVVFVHRALLEARDRGAAVLVLSADLAELWEIADRIMVMVEGRLRGPVPVAQTSQQEIGHWMTVR